MSPSATVLLLTLAFMFTACNDDEAEASAKPTEATEATEATSIAAALGPVQFRRVLAADEPDEPQVGETPTPTEPPVCAEVAETVLDPDAGATACDSQGTVYRLSPAVIVGGITAAEAAPSPSAGDWSVQFSLDRRATARFAKLTHELVGGSEQFSVVLDGVVLSAPRVVAEVTDGESQIDGNFTEAEAEALAARLLSGQG